jgi:hypothetical protein
VKVYGKGHVICYNRFSHFHDAVCVDTHGLPEGPDQKCVSIDIYGNDIFNMSDDFIESDGGCHNIRVFGNRGFNSYHASLSAQPVFGGPVYFIRNILYHTPGTTLKFMIRPAGIFLYNNTFCAETNIHGFSNGHFRNNLFMGPDVNAPALSGATFTTYSSLDYNGYRAKKSAVPYRWGSPAGPEMNHSDREELVFKDSKSLKEFSAATGYEIHGIELEYDIFEKAGIPDPAKRGHVYPVAGFDFRLRKGSKAIDAGCILPNITDGYTGNAPDLGALEYGGNGLHFGPRTK